MPFRSHRNGEKKRTKVGTYTINLDLPPEQRWTELAKAKASQIKTLLDGFKDFVKDFGAAAQYLIDFIDSQG
ncbi:acid ceramidase, partial [Plakobranchus ocellatus]